VIIAHAGHWLTSVLYVLPVAAIAIAVWVQGRRDRREGRTPDDDVEPSLDDIMDGR